MARLSRGNHFLESPIERHPWRPASRQRVGAGLAGLATRPIPRPVLRWRGSAGTTGSRSMRSSGRVGHSSHEAEDLVQGFLADLLERGDLARLDQSKGRFRAFLRAACDHYLSNRRDHDRAAKRGGRSRSSRSTGGMPRVDIRREPSHRLTPERLFEREWALALLARVLDRLEAESVKAGNEVFFERVRPALQKDGLAPSYRVIAEELGMSEAAVRAAARRIRLRYREIAPRRGRPHDR